MIQLNVRHPKEVEKNWSFIWPPPPNKSQKKAFTLSCLWCRTTRQKYILRRVELVRWRCAINRSVDDSVYGHCTVCNPHNTGHCDTTNDILHHLHTSSEQWRGLVWQCSPAESKRCITGQVQPPSPDPINFATRTHFQPTATFMHLLIYATAITT